MGRLLPAFSLGGSFFVSCYKAATMVYQAGKHLLAINQGTCWQSTGICYTAGGNVWFAKGIAAISAWPGAVVEIDWVSAHQLLLRQSDLFFVVESFGAIYATSNSGNAQESRQQYHRQSMFHDRFLSYGEWVRLNHSSSAFLSPRPPVEQRACQAPEKALAGAFMSLSRCQALWTRRPQMDGNLRLARDSATLKVPRR